MLEQRLALHGGASAAVNVDRGILELRLSIAGRTLAVLMTPAQAAAFSGMVSTALDATP